MKRLAIAIFAISGALAGEMPQVRLLPSPFKDNMMRERRFLESLHPLALTRQFRVNMGLGLVPEDEFVMPLGGWEAPDIEIRGHSCGHYLSGMASLYEATGDESVRRRAAEVVHILRKCQQNGKTGYLSAFPEEHIDKIIRGKRTWAPWYALHKILAGLIDQYELCGNEEALEAAVDFGRWAAAKTLALSPEEAATMRRFEFGGIAESLIRLAKLAKNDDFRRAAEVFHDEAVFGPIDGKHANTLIPKMIAEWHRGEKERVEAFWREVAGHYMYAPGCVSEKEAFRGPDRQADFLTGRTGETCCTYNLLKLSRLLFAETPRADIADYQERALFNHILGQMEPLDGNLTYFMPVMTGSYKLQSRPNDSFWCCVGSSMESHTRYHRLVCAEAAGELYINLYIPSEIKWRGLVLRLETRFPEESTARLSVVDGEADAAINTRAPFWAASGKNGVSSYARRERTWRKGDSIEIDLSCSLRTESPAGRDDLKSVFWGPFLLAARLGVDGMRKNALRSANYFTHDYSVPPHLKSVAFEAPETWRRIPDAPSYDRGLDGASPELPDFFAHPSFITPSGLTVSPLWAIHAERFAIYFSL